MKPIGIIIPAYKPDQKCLDTVNDVIDAGFEHVIVVDDGSGEEFEPIFRSISAIPEVTLLKHASNKGKGRAMKTAFEHLLDGPLQLGGVITADADGQHLASDMIKLAERMKEEPDAVVLGARDFTQKHVPFRSRFGNKLTRILFRLSTGLKLADTQTGLRGIPYRHLPLMLEVAGERYEFEMNMLAKVKDHDIPISEVTIETVYIEENKSSHFHPLRDSFHIYKIFVFYALSGGASFLLDIALFWMFVQILRDESPEFFIVLATVSARVLSSLFNYYINRNKVFAQGSRKSLIRYFILAAVIMLASAASVHLLYAEWLGRGEIVLKMLVDAVLFVFGFVVQRAWVFRKEE
ncbi:glycosyltransferase [Planomicrobium sp. YIM 101495]|uniref:glycosyltransferase n=1 Tax=Planomicrobium sp. YIM 101495 TaxID=2665160 RepID=UPI0013FCD960|nr:glycosyltransferase [Planomicrobium sp. YIM 101495]